MKTDRLYYWNKMLCGPLEAIYTLLIFILSMEMNATAVQLVILSGIKPVVSLLAFYLNSVIEKKAHRIKPFLIALNLLGALPAVFFPFVHSIWYYIASYFLFMVTFRATYPAWTELLKTSRGIDAMRGVVTKGSLIAYAITTIVPLGIGSVLDSHIVSWRMLFAIIACLQVCNFIPLFLIRSPSKGVSESVSVNVIDLLAAPWRGAWKLCRQRVDFFHYLIMFLLGGAGLVALQAVIPSYFKENLHLSYKQLTLAISAAKGLAFLLSAPIWARWFSQEKIYKLNVFVNVFSCLFIAFLAASNFSSECLLIAYVCYGIMQSSCELSWNMSSAIFSRQQESIRYSGVNLAFIGVRGLVFPGLGQWLYLHFGVYSVFGMACVFCLSSLVYAATLHRSTRKLATG